MTDIVSREEAIATRILTIRNKRIMLDRALAPLYGVTPATSTRR
jgi:hypothetical protein